VKVVRKKTRDGDEQIFEILQSRKDLAQWLREMDVKSGNKWYDEDTSISFYDTSGKFYHIEEGGVIPRFNVAKIRKLLSVGDATTVIYGKVSIVFNEKYGDWETEF
jgi:hypothetical protein